MSYQPEERYWTDYLRIALPVVGLLLMLVLFWFWVSNVIGGNDTKTKPSPTPAVKVTESTIVAPTNTPVPTKAITIAPTKSGLPGGDKTPAPAKPTPEATAVSDVCVEGNQVTVSENGVRMRDDASTQGGLVVTLNQGDSLTVTGSPKQADGYTWCPVKDASGNAGYVADQFLAAT